MADRGWQVQGSKKGALPIAMEKRKHKTVTVSRGDPGAPNTHMGVRQQ